ncbi:hydantoinase/oxoprolinase family protein [Actinomadura sp. DC4]|uniref:hydantoinase/oxoprolinase family protein n=1 Tax=Actinomadura sp. DC4 TaxID=3055069 RepID=UPI0025AF433B|nr:hydantoinase/oxoprolinase family protein [Actinomadura sp. DC4]MDN3353607.1 hydantoinase/oxoprolinase family protein [Actinomadura sp. DC4]
MTGVRVGIDVGGTFTDVVLAVPGDGRVLHHKEPSTPGDPSRAVADGLAAIVAAAGLSPGDLTSVTHGTTIGLNAVIQRRGARIALVVTEGYRDVLEIGRSRMPSSFDLYAGKEEPLVPRDRIVEIAARLGPDGERVAVPDEAELDRVAAELTAAEAEAAAVVVLHSYTDPAFEEEVTARLRERLPDLRLASSATIWPEVREYERTLVACLNAYIQPLMRGYFDRLAERLAGIGVTAPIYITASNGGSLGLPAAAARPLETVLSGPASGVMAAARLAGGGEPDRLVTFDMGGTSSDIAVAVSGRPEFTTHTTIGGLPLILPVVAVTAIGAGGGSVVWVDEQGLLKVGPDSAGADPGPVAYGRGGTRPTVTDCYLLTGIIDPAVFLGGRMGLDADASAKALAGVAARLGWGDDGEAAAVAALRVATAAMATELRKTLAQRGLEPARFTLVPYGGAGPTHAAILAEEVGIGHVVVPPTAATFCALGAAGADLRRDFARSIRRRLDEDGAARLREILADLAGRAHRWLADQGAATGTPELLFSADLRYAGQAYELRVPLDGAAPEAADVAEALHAGHERLYGFRDTDAAIELGTARLAIVAATGEIPPSAVPRGEGTPGPSSRRSVLLAGGRVDAEVYDRAGLRAADRLSGPAIVEQDDTTVLIPPGWSADVDPAGNLHLRRRP